MGNRLSKIVTKTGDEGITGLGDGQRVAKSSARIQTIGAVDETNSCIGVVIAFLEAEEQPDSEVIAQLRQIQNDLFDLGGELSMPGFQLIQPQHVQRLEQWLEPINNALPPLKNFILPGGSPATAQCHLARSICRRAEREAVALDHAIDLNQALLQYLNRLSDYLFVVSRHMAVSNGGKEILWQKTVWEEEDKSEDKGPA